MKPGQLLELYLPEGAVHLVPLAAPHPLHQEGAPGRNSCVSCPLRATEGAQLLLDFSVQLPLSSLAGAGEKQKAVPNRAPFPLSPCFLKKKPTKFFSLP